MLSKNTEKNKEYYEQNKEQNREYGRNCYIILFEDEKRQTQKIC